MALKEIINKDVSTVRSGANLNDVARLMYKNHTGAVIVINNKDKNKEKGKPIGVITDRDIALEFGKSGKIDPKKNVDQIMTTSPVTCNSDDGIYETIQKMREHGVRRIPVVNKKEHLVGIVASDDLINLLGNEIYDLSQIINYNSIRSSSKPRVTL